LQSCRGRRGRDAALAKDKLFQIVGIVERLEARGVVLDGGTARRGEEGDATGRSGGRRDGDNSDCTAK
jgi:hypothetical protein